MEGGGGGDLDSFDACQCSQCSSAGFKRQRKGLEIEIKAHCFMGLYLC